jgi:hypothetical protein
VGITALDGGKDVSDLTHGIEHTRQGER